MLGKNFIILFIFTFFWSQSQVKADDLLGNWIATDNSVAVKVYQINNEYRAKVLWFDEKLGSGKPMYSRHDTQNPDPELQKRKIIGMEILEGLEFNPETRSWENGKIYDASSGRTWDSVASFSKDGTLKVRGYWKFKWIGKSLIFRRLNVQSIKKY